MKHNLPPVPAPPAPAKLKATIAYDKKFCNTVKTLGATGLGLVDVLAELGITVSIHEQWLQQYTDYAMAWEAHSALLKAFYAEIEKRRARAIGSSRGRNIYTHTMAQDVYDMVDFSLSDAELAAAFGVSKRTLQKWVDAHEDFRDAMEWYATQAEAHWMSLGGKYAFMPSKASQPRLYTFQMANRFGMVESLKIDHHASAEALTKPRVQINAVRPDKPSPTT